jgi:hypothetical protein
MCDHGTRPPSEACANVARDFGSRGGNKKRTGWLVRPDARACLLGAYGEASSDVHTLLTVAADGLAARQWRDMGARTQEKARSFIVSSLRRRLWASSSAASSHATASAGCRTSACRGPSSSGACSAASSSEDRRRECRSTCRTPTSSSTRPARDGWPAARKRARTPRVPQGGRRRETELTRLVESRIVLELHAASVPHTDL